MAKQVNPQHPVMAGPDKSYFGKVCRHHPDANGERYLSNNSCIECVRRRAVNGGQVVRYRKLVKEARHIMVAMIEGANDHDAKMFLAKLEAMGV